jgi:hypothetical protein
MGNLNLRNITNHFQDVHLISLASWAAAKEIAPCDPGGPYVVTQEGFDPADLKMIPDEFVLGRSGQWLSLGQFFRMPVPERRTEFLFGTAAGVMAMMEKLPSKAVLLGAGAPTDGAAATPGTDEMAAVFHAEKNKLSRSKN